MRVCLSILLIVLAGALPSFSAGFPPYSMAVLSCGQSEMTPAAVEDMEAKAISYLEISLSQQNIFLNRQELWKIYGYSMGEGGIGERTARSGKERQILMYAAMLRAILMPNPHSADIFPQVPIAFSAQDKVAKHYINMRIVGALFQDILLGNEQATSFLAEELTKRFKNLPTSTIRRKVERFRKDHDFQAVLRNYKGILVAAYQQQEKDINPYKDVQGEVNYLLPVPSEFKTLEQFLAKMASDKRSAIAFTRSIFDAVELFQLSESGFSLHTSDLFFGLWLSGTSSMAHKSANIRIKQSYSSENSFKEYLTGFTKPVSQNDHAVHFFSKRNIGYGTGLIIPKKGYVSIYSFSKQATEEEIHDFWRLIYQVYTQGRPDGKSWQGFAFHLGSNHAQTVAHVHARLEG